MKLLLKSVKVYDVNSRFNNKKVDILIEKGIIKSIKANIKVNSGVKVISSNNLNISPGWFDLRVNYCDPGYEYREDLLSGTKAAANGGFTGVAIMPSTSPPIDSKADIEYILNKTKNNLVNVYPVGAISNNLEAKNLAELYDMHLAGAIAFSNDSEPIKEAGLLLRALLYSKSFNGKMLTWCYDKSISPNGMMNEGEISTSLGLTGIPSLAEEMMVSRNIAIAEYADAPIHICSVSTAGSIELIASAKKRKIKVTASVNAYNLAFDDSLLTDFDSNYKVNPPLRGKKDIIALWKGIANGTIDAIVSDHRPLDVEAKKVEFDNALFGMAGQETVFALINSNISNIKLDQLLQLLYAGPRNILGLKLPTIEEGEDANITAFDPDKDWLVSEKSLLSKSKNTPLVGKTLQGKVVASINNGKLHLA